MASDEVSPPVWVRGQDAKKTETEGKGKRHRDDVRQTDRHGKERKQGRSRDGENLRGRRRR